MGIDAVPMLFLRVRMGATARNRLYTTMQVDYFSTVLDLGQHILLEIDPTDIEYQLRTIQIDFEQNMLSKIEDRIFCRGVGSKLSGFIPGGTSTSTRKSSPTISETIPRKGRIDTKIVGRSSAGRDAQPLKSNHGIISENMAIFRNIDKYIYLQIY